jgi:gas vesicle protein
MTFDLLTFLIGVGVGALTGSLAGILYSLERTADLQEEVRRVTREVENMKAHLAQDKTGKITKLDELDRELEEIHEEIRRMYKKTTR